MRLVVEDEAGTRSTVPFTGDELVVGRAAEGVAVRLSDRDVSRRHARFLRASGSVHVEDLGSLTGTRVNGERITSRRRLREGDLVQIGSYDLALFGEAVTAAPGSPPPLPPTPRPPSGETPAPATAPDPAAQRPPAPATPLPPQPVRAPLPPRPATEPARASPGDGAGAIARRALVAGLAALLLGAAAGYAIGTATAPPAPPAALTRP